jgi:hypothetical protein
MWILFTVVISILALVFWLIYLLRFNVFKRYGLITPIGRLKVFLLYFVSVSAIVLFSYVEPYVETIRANNNFGNDEIVNDINTINLNICQLEYDSLTHDWRRDTTVVVKKRHSSSDGEVVMADTAATVNSSTTTDTVVLQPHPPYPIIDTAELHSKQAKGDSLIKLTDSLYIILTCPDYIFLTEYDVDKFSNAKLFSSADIYKKILQHYRTPDKTFVTTQLMRLITKYSNPNWHTYNYDYENPSYQQRVEKRYSLNPAENGIKNITERKYRWKEPQTGWIIRLFFYFTFVITLLIFIFRHTTTKTFFLSLLAAVLISILTSLFMAFASFSETGFLGIIIFYFFVFLAVSLVSLSGRVRSVVAGICINLFTLLAGFIPLVVVGLYYVEDYYDRYNNYQVRTDKYYEIKQIAFLCAEIAGPVLLLILIPTLIQKLYRNWYALPQE